MLWLLSLENTVQTTTNVEALIWHWRAVKTHIWKVLKSMQQNQIYGLCQFVNSSSLSKPWLGINHDATCSSTVRLEIQVSYASRWGAAHRGLVNPLYSAPSTLTCVIFEELDWTPNSSTYWHKGLTWLSNTWSSSSQHGKVEAVHFIFVCYNTNTKLNGFPSIPL